MTLTQRQLDITRLALEGLSNKAISARLILSNQTTRNHLCAAYKMQPELRRQVRQARINAKPKKS